MVATNTDIENHPISIEKAKELMAGDLGVVYRSILRGCCLPIYWFRLDKDAPSILHNGTLTLLKTPQCLLGVTAAHVIREYEKDTKAQSVRLQFMNEVVDDLLNQVIAISDRLDLATIRVDESLLKRMGKEIVPLSAWPPQTPMQGRGIMLAGYPGIDRLTPKKLEANFGLFTALGTASSVSDEQITWRVEREYHVKSGNIPDLPQNYNLGGISGGPLISWFESASHLTHYRLSGIVSEANSNLEYVVARRADFIREDGSISKGLV